jgi:hypothetical protein
MLGNMLELAVNGKSMLGGGHAVPVPLVLQPSRLDCHVQVTDPADQVREWGIQHGITKDVLISLMGGSP